jgi:hypothetical protein
MMRQRIVPGVIKTVMIAARILLFSYLGWRTDCEVIKLSLRL